MKTLFLLAWFAAASLMAGSLVQPASAQSGNAFGIACPAGWTNSHANPMCVPVEFAFRQDAWLHGVPGAASYVMIGRFLCPRGQSITQYGCRTPFLIAETDVQWVVFQPCPEGMTRGPGGICVPDSIFPPGDPGDPPRCPAGWVPAEPPLNPALGCLPTTLVAPSAPPPVRTGGDGICPRGWRAVTAPGDPVLACLPGDAVVLPKPGQAQPVGRCPSGWRPIAQGGTAMLICAPQTLEFALDREWRATEPSPFCRPGWRRIDGLGDAGLICQPGNLVPVAREDAGIPPGQCPEGWRQATPPLNPILGCVNAQITMATAD